MDFPLVGRVSKPMISSCHSAESLGGAVGTTFSGSGSSAVSGSGAMRAMPLTLTAPYMLRKFWWLNGTTASGSVDAAVLTLSGTRICSVGGVAQAGTSVMQAAAPSGGTVILQPGRYYMSLSASNGVATFLRANPSQAVCQLAGACEVTSGAYPIPATNTLVALTSSFIPHFGISSLTVI